MRVLVTGGAGYIGSVAATALIYRGHSVHVVDDLRTGYQELVPRGATFTHASFDHPAVVALMQDWKPDAIVHLAASAIVQESQHSRRSYAENNVYRLKRFCIQLAQMRSLPLSKFIFSSTCSVYGSGIPPFSEHHVVHPENFYAQTKLDGETFLKEFFEDSSVAVAILRFFNVAGSNVQASLGEVHHPETHLIPNAIFAAESGTPLRVFGNDFRTPDGTAIRDYVHVEDVAAAIWMIAEQELQMPFEVLNVGSSNPSSVLQVVRKVAATLRQTIDLRYEPRRRGDPDSLYANCDRIMTKYGWFPKMSTLDSIVPSSCEWRNSEKFLRITAIENRSRS